MAACTAGNREMIRMIRVTKSEEGERTIITIDGPAGSGKSSAARRLAQRLGFEFLDGPVTPKPEKIPEPKKKRRSSQRRSKPSGPKGGGGSPSGRGSVPKVPLVKV